MILSNESCAVRYIDVVIREVEKRESILNIFNSILLDGMLYNHSFNVAELSTALAINLNLDADTIKDICLAGLLHDIGKINIPKKILYKPNKLTKEEYEIVKRHPIDGYNICKDSGISEEVLQMILNHHEKSDGSGYPFKIKDIPQTCSIITVSDIFSALIEHRCYHQARGISSALEHISTFKELDQDIINLLKIVVKDSD